MTVDWLLVGLIFVIFLALWAEFVNGWTDAPNAIATVVATGALNVRVAIVMAMILNTVGAFFGTAVAATIGKGIVDSSAVTLPAIAGAMIAIIVWGTFAGKVGLPISKSHALIAGIAGAGLACAGPNALLIDGWIKVGLGMMFSILLTFPMAYIIGKLILLFCGGLKTAPTEKVFDKLQIASAASMAFAHGMGDSQKFVGIILMILTVTKASASYAGFAWLESWGTVSPDGKTFIPIWVIVICALTMGLGTSLGGYKIIAKIGHKMAEIKTWQGFAAEAGASTVIAFASSRGIPLSTTHTIVSGILGAASAKRFSNVRWGVFGGIAIGWFATFFICGTLGFVAATVANWLTGH